MHLGLLGPRRVVSGDVDSPQPPPYHLVDNEFTLLEASDLVFIDPVATGYSRAAAGEDPKQFHGITQDVESVGDFIRLYVSRAKRWRSPKYLIGESYGTTRAAGLSGYLQDRHGMYLNGIMLVSTALDFMALDFELGNDLPHVLFLPTYTATAWYHKRLAPDLQADLDNALAEAEAFAEGEYATALLRGSKLSAEERATLAQKVARLTGLSPDYVERTNLRVEIFKFCKELLRDQRRTVGRLDSRFTGIERDATGDHFAYDPANSFIKGSYTATLNDYVRGELNFESDLPYEVLTSLYQTWDYSSYQNRYVNVAETLRDAMSKNPHLRVYVAQGIYDFATPYFASEHTFNHLELDPSLEGNIERHRFAAGHMMYVHEPSLAEMCGQLVAFVKGKK
jgi:carboxypeptidase C (cathepsin A)